MQHGPTKLFLPCLILLMIFLGNLHSAPSPQHPGSSDQPLRIVLKLKSGENVSPSKGADGFISLGVSRVDEIGRQFGIADQKPLFPEKAKFSGNGALGNIAVIDLSPGTDPEAVLSAYRRLSEVEYAQIDYKLELYDIPNDTLYNRQWSLDNTGQPYYSIKVYEGPNNDRLITTTGAANSDINAQPVFDNPPDNTSTVIIAIIDTGVDTGHPELQNRIWTNPDEIPDNGFDDDHNGYIDDIHGWDFCGDTSTVYPVPDNDPTDYFGHGTHCAGIVAAITNNDLGMAGIVDDCRIMPIKFYPMMLSSYAAQAIVYAADNDADIISMSFGYPWPIEILEDALNYAQSKGVILCASAGNDGAEYKNYPAASEYTIAISATNSSDRVASFSTYGSHIDIAAPGEDILSLRAAGSDIYASRGEPNVHIIASDYYLASGTSMSAPHVAAVAAYMRAVCPGLTPASTKQILEQTADDLLDPMGDSAYLPGWDKYSGFGRVNLANALAAVPSRRVVIESPHSNQIVSGIVPIIGICEASDAGDYTLEYGSGYTPLQWTELYRSYISRANDTLGYWNTAGLNGIYTIRIKLGETNISYASVCVINNNSISISTPQSGDTINNYAEIKGSALCGDFDHYTISWAPATDANDWTDVYTSSRPIENDLLTAFNSTPLSPGNYVIKLSVYSGNSLAGIDLISVYIKDPFSGEDSWRIALDTLVSITASYGDFDGDGTNEIVVGTADGLRFFNTSGSQVQVGIPEMQGYDFQGPPAVGRIDYDSTDDLVALAKGMGESGMTNFLYAFPSSDTAYRLELTFELDFLSYGYSDVESVPYVALKDIDMDGCDEIFVYSAQGSGIYRWEPGPGLVRLSTVSNLTSYPADLNGDGFDEFYYTNGNYLLQTDQSGVISKTFNLQGDHILNYVVKTMSAVDVDADKKAELVIWGYYDSSIDDYWVYLFNENLQLMPGWPHNTGINSYLVPTTPAFYDLDHDSLMEYFVSLYEISQGYILAWDMDGEPVNSSYQSGIWTSAPNPAIISPPLIADLSGDGFADVLVEAKRDMFQTYKAERLVSWDKEGQVLSGWPIITIPAEGPYLQYGIHTPTLGDIDKDGIFEVIATTAANELVYKKIDGSAYDSTKASVLSWKYNRRLNNCFMPYGDGISVFVADIDETPGGVIPDRLELSQNNPNPFNASTKITFSLPKHSRVTFRVINILGQTMESTDLGELDAGKHALTWQAEDTNSKSYPTGIYFYQIKTDEFISSKKMVLLK